MNGAIAVAVVIGTLLFIGFPFGQVAVGSAKKKMSEQYPRAITDYEFGVTIGFRRGVLASVIIAILWYIFA